MNKNAAIGLLLVFSLMISLIPIKYVFADTLESANANNPLPDKYTVLDMNGGIVFESAGDKTIEPGGMVGIMMALILLEGHGLSDEVLASMTFTPPDGASIAVDHGEIFSLEQLLYALLLSAANDAALVLAEFDAGSEEAFVEKMNAKAKELHLDGTKYTRAIDIGAESHVSTVGDLAVLTREAMKLEAFRNIVNSANYIIEPTNKKSEARNYIFQKNAFVLDDGKTMQYSGEQRPIYDASVSGVKVDFWSKGTYTIVTTCEKDGMYLVFASAGEGSEDSAYAKHRALMDKVYSEFEPVNVVNKGEILYNTKVKGAENAGLNIVAKDSFKIILPKGTDVKTAIKTDLKLLEMKNIVIEKGVKLGDLTVLKDGKELGKIEAVAEQSVDEGSFLGGVLEVKKEKSSWEIALGIGIFIFQVFLVFFLWTYAVRKHRVRMRKKEMREQANKMQKPSNITDINDYRYNGKK